MFAPEAGVRGARRGPPTAPRHSDSPRPSSPDVSLMDLRMPGMDGLTAITELARRGIAARVLVLTTHHTDSHVPTIEAGATGSSDAPREHQTGRNISPTDLSVTTAWDAACIPNGRSTQGMTHEPSLVTVPSTESARDIQPPMRQNNLYARSGAHDCRLPRTPRTADLRAAEVRSAVTSCDRRRLPDRPARVSVRLPLMVRAAYLMSRAQLLWCRSGIGS